jgi:ABC-type dipeptide/oligopeptide/nickel transport system permease component
MNPLVETLVIVGKRLGWMLLTLWIVYTFSFFLMRAVPGGPFAADRKFRRQSSGDWKRAITWMSRSRCNMCGIW